jgi:hypothetical protein
MPVALFRHAVLMREAVQSGVSVEDLARAASMILVMRLRPLMLKRRKAMRPAACLCGTSPAPMAAHLY